MARADGGNDAKRISDLEVRGRRRGINGGAFFFLRLSRSRVEVHVPLIGYFPTQPEPDAGIVPDLPVRWRAEDVAAGVDPDLEAVRRALGARRRT